MAFQVLIDLITNVGKLQADIASIKQNTAELTQQQVRAARDLETQQAGIDDKRRVATAAAQQSVRNEVAAKKQIVAINEEIAQTQAKISELMGADASAFSSQIRFLQEKLTLQRSGLAGEKQALEAAKLVTEQYKTQVLTLKEEARDIAANARGDRNKLQDQVFANQNRIRGIQEQAIQAQRTQRGAAGLGFALQQTGIGPLQAIATPLIATGLGGPEAGALALVGQAVGAIASGISSWVGFLKEATVTAFEFSQQMELSKIATAGVLAQSSRIVDGQGNVLEGQAKFNAALEISSELQQSLLEKVLKTNITYEEGNLAVQSSIGFLTARGVQANDALEIIVRLTAAAKAAGLDGAKAAQQVRSVLAGVQDRSILAKLVSQGGKVDIKQLANLEGEQATIAYLRVTDQLARGVKATTDNFKTQLVNVADSIKFILGKAFSESFTNAGKEIGKLTDTLFTKDNKLGTGGQAIKDAFKALFDQLYALSKTIFTTENLTTFIGLLDRGVTLTTELLRLFTSMSQLTFGPKGITGVIDRLNYAFADIPGSQKLGSAASSTAKDLFSEAQGKGLNLADTEKIVSAYVKTITDAQDKLTAAAKAGHALDIFTFGHPAGMTADVEAQAKKAAEASMDVAVKANKDAADAANKKTDKSIAGSTYKVVDTARDLRDTSGGDITKLDAQIARLQGQLTTLQDRLASNDTGGFIRVAGATTPEDAINKITDALTRLNAERDRLASRQASLDAIRLETAERLKNAAAIYDEIDALKKEKDEQSTSFKISADSRLRKQGDSIDKALGVQASLMAAGTALEGLRADSKLLAENEAETAKQSIVVAASLRDRVELMKKIREEGEQRATDIGNTIPETQAKLETQQAQQDTRRAEAIGISGPGLAIAKELQDQAKLNQERVVEGITLTKKVTELESIVSVLQSLNVEGAADDSIARINEYISLLQVQVRLNQDLAKNEEVRNQLAVYRLGIEQQSLTLTQAQATLSANEAQIKEQVAAGFLSQLSGENQIRAITEQKIALEEQLQKNYKDQLALLDEQLVYYRNIEDAQQAMGQDSLKTSNTIKDAVNTQSQLNIKLIESQTAVIGLKSEFSNVYKILAQSTDEIGKFFDAINLPKVGGLFTSFSKVFQGIQQINTQKSSSGKTGVLGFIGSIADTFNDIKKSFIPDTTAADSLANRPDSTGTVSAPELKLETTGGAFKSGAGAIAGAVGALSSATHATSAALGAASKALGAAGPIAEGALAAFSIIQSLFTAGARKMAEDIQKSVTAIGVAFNTGQINLSTAITQLQAQYQQTFVLAQKKGGADLALQQQQALSQQIASLQKQRTDIINSFNTALSLQDLGAGFKDFASAIQQAETAITNFIGAGGSVDKAQKYLNGILKQFQSDLESSVNQQQLAALNRAQTLIDLNQQLSDLELKHTQTLQSIVAQGLASRQLTFGQQKAQQTAAENEQYQKQHDSLTDQISLNQQLLDVEKALVPNSIDLTNIDAVRLGIITDQVTQRQKEVDILKEQMAIIGGIAMDSSGNMVLTPALFQQLQDAGVFSGTGVTVGSLNLTVTVNGAQVTGLPLSGPAGDSLKIFINNLLTEDLAALGINPSNIQP